MPTPIRSRFFLTICAIHLWNSDCAAENNVTPEQREFFEKKIRPVLATECYECHSTHGKQRAGLILDHREALLKGSDNGTVIRPGDPNRSLLLDAIKHTRGNLKMPKARVKLSDTVIEDFADWIAMGAPDPRDVPPSQDEIESANDWEAAMDRRKQWWSFQPITMPAIPATESSSTNAIDHFLEQKRAQAGLNPAQSADRRTLLRRLSFRAYRVAAITRCYRGLQK